MDTIIKSNNDISSDSESDLDSDLDTDTDTDTEIKKLCAYGQEDLSFISDKTLKKILETGYSCIENLIKYIHLNEDKPEYHNVHMSLKDNNIMKVYNGKKWNKVNTSIFIREQTNKLILYLEKRIPNMNISEDYIFLFQGIIDIMKTYRQHKGYMPLDQK